MSRARYFITRSRTLRCGLHEFGVVCAWDEADEKKTLRIDAVTPNLSALAAFVGRLNRHGAQECHFRDLVDDFIQSQTCISG